MQPVGFPSRAHVARACQLLMADAERFLGTPGPFEATIVGLQERTQSTIYVIRISNGNAAEKKFYLKTLNFTSEDHSKEVQQVSTEYNILAELWPRYATSRKVGVIKPVAVLPEDLSLITEECPGENVDSVIARTRTFCPMRERAALGILCHNAGLWLADFQDFTTKQNSKFDVGELVLYCEERLKILVEAIDSGIDATQGRKILDRIERKLIEIGRDDLVMTGRQNDYRPDNMLAKDGRLIVLDFTGFTYGPKLYDYMKFWMRLDYYAFGPYMHGSLIDFLKRQFAEGYGHRVNIGSPLAEILRCANILDKMSELVETPRRLGGRWLLDALWYRRLHTELRRQNST